MTRGGARVREEAGTTLAFLLLLSASLLSFGVSLRGGLVWDDEYILRERYSDLEASPGNVLRILTGHVHETYRPLRALSHVADAWFFRTATALPGGPPVLIPAGFHLGNLLLHALCSLAAYILARRLLRDPTAALVGALLFAVHPVHAESVAYVKGRTDLLAALPLLVAWARVASPAWRGDRGTAILFLLALFAREGSICFWPVALLTRWILLREPFRESLKRTSSLGACAAAFGLAYAALGPPAASRQGRFVEGLGGGLLLALECLGAYGRLLFWPLPLVGDYIGLERAPRDPLLVLAGAGILAGLGLAAARGRRAGLGAFALLAAAATLGPVSNVIPIKAFLAERYLYLGSVPVLVSLGMTVRGRRTAVLPLAIVLSSYTALSAWRAGEWRASRPLWESCVRNHPFGWRAGLNLGNAALDAGDGRRAIAAYRFALRANPGYADAVHSIGIAHLRAGRPGEALDPLWRAHRMRPEDGQTLEFLLFALRLSRGDPRAAPIRRDLSAEGFLPPDSP